MKKYLVDIYLPAAGQHLNVLLPNTKRIGEVIGLLVQVSEPLTGGSYKGTGSAMLLDAELGIPYDVNRTVEEAGIRNASHLLLI